MRIVENKGGFDVVDEDGYVVAKASSREVAETILNDPMQKDLLARRMSVREKEQK